MNFPDQFFDFLLAPFNMLMESDSQTFWITYPGTAFFAFAVYAWKRRKKTLRLRAMLKYVFPKKIFLHPSTLLDFKLFCVGAFYLFIQAGILLSVTSFLNAGVCEVFQTIFGSSEPLFKNTSTGAKLLIPVIIILFYELGYWISHYLMHVVPFLWEFHKVHHSAEIMTPLTELRQHPVDFLFIPFFISATLSIVFGAILWLYGENAEVYKYWDMGIFVVIIFSTYGHLRHSHVSIGGGKIISHIFQTPAQHHIHHSTDRAHFDKNMGFCLSIWDWAFGTLYIPEKDLKIEYGVNDPMRKDYSVVNHVFRPFRESYRVVQGYKHPFSKTGSRKE